MSSIILYIIVIGVMFFIIGLMDEMGLYGIIFALIGGGTGFALGSLANIGWGIFGAVLGALIAIAVKKQFTFKSY